VQGPPPPDPRGGNRAPPIHERVGADADVRATLEARRRNRDEAESRRYRPRRGGRYDPDHDRSTSPEPPGPRVFSEAIRRAGFPARFRQPANLTKYSGETNPELWLAWRVSLAERMMTYSSSATSHCIWPIQPEHGSSTFLTA